MLELTAADLEMVSGGRGPAAQLAMSILVRMAPVYGALTLMDITQAHIDSTLYLGDATLEFAERLASLGARVAVPTTLNVSGVDECGWKDWAVSPEWAAKAARQMLAYERMGAVPTWTCAPYQTQMRPTFGQQIAWGESNAIAFANSVIGARTERYPDLLDICCAITGRAPAALHPHGEPRGPVGFFRGRFAGAATGRSAFRGVRSPGRKLAEDRILVVDGLGSRRGQLKAFAAAVVSSGRVALFIVGIMPEATDR
jgi:predicted aconitase